MPQDIGMVPNLRHTINRDYDFARDPQRLLTAAFLASDLSGCCGDLPAIPSRFAALAQRHSKSATINIAENWWETLASRHSPLGCKAREPSDGGRKLPRRNRTPGRQSCNLIRSRCDGRQRDERRAAADVVIASLSPTIAHRPNGPIRFDSRNRWNISTVLTNWLMNWRSFIRSNPIHLQPPSHGQQRPSYGQTPGTSTRR
jgi:hypothetical protein